MTNIAELLKDAPKGMKLYSPLLGEVEFAEVMDTDYVPIRVMCGIIGERFDKYGRYKGNEYPDAECLLFPSKEVRTWEGWKLPAQPKFKVGTWLWHKTKGVFPMMVEDYDEKEGYLMQFTDETKCYFGRDIIENDYRLWNFGDSKLGDILYDKAYNRIGIFENFGHHPDGGSFNDKTYCYLILYYDIDDNEFYEKTCNDMDGYDAIPATKEQRDLFFAKMKEAGYQWDADKKELRKIIKPMFKVGDWITDGNITVQIEDIRNNSYIYSDGVLYSTRTADKVYHLWSIADAKDGDVLVLNGFSKEYKWIGIFKALTSDTSFSSHCHYNCGMCEFITDIARCTKHGIKYNDIRPATNEERDILFAKMREAGYTWDENKKELKKFPKKHYDISSFHAGMPVLVRNKDNHDWNYVLFSHRTKYNSCRFGAGSTIWEQCIPFNEDTKHLLGTTDMPDEMYINW